MEINDSNFPGGYNYYLVTLEKLLFFLHTIEIVKGALNYLTSTH